MLITRVEKATTTLVVLVASRHGNSQGRAMAKHLGSHLVSAKVLEKEESPVSAAKHQRRAVAKQMYPETQTARPSLWVNATSADYLVTHRVGAQIWGEIWLTMRTVRNAGHMVMKPRFVLRS